MKKLLLFVALMVMVCVGRAAAQNQSQTPNQSEKPDTAEYPYWIEMMQYDTVNYYAVRSAFYKYQAAHVDEDADKKEEGKGEEEDEGIELFKRWEYLNRSRIKADGTRITAGDIAQTYNQYLSGKSSSAIKGAVKGATAPSGSNPTGNWSSVGPVAPPANRTGQPNGMGRVNAIAFHPTNKGTIYIGAPDGGLWVSTDTGATWSTKTDGLASLGVSAIAIDPNTTSTIYLGTGDRDGGDATGIGVMKSTNSGSSWSSANSGMGNAVVSKLLINPSNSSILLAATSGGIYRTTNGGGSWARTSSQLFFKDMVFKPHNANVVYATASGAFYRSTNNGASWTQITSGLGSAYRGVITVTAADTNRVYFVTTSTYTFSACYISTNGGTSFRTKSTTPNIMDYSDNGSANGGQAFYDLCVVADTANAGTLYVGGINIFKSTDSGATWTVVAHWVGTGVPDIHADIHVFAINPLSNRLYAGNDGGIYYTADGGTTWKDISPGLSITEIYKMAQSATRPDLELIGCQDNGSSQYAKSKWYFVLGGDGMACAVDAKDTDYQYAEIYYGTIYQSTDAGNTFYNNIAANGIGGINETGPWVTNYMISNFNNREMYAGYDNIWRCTNLKTSSPTWTRISDSLENTNSELVEAMDQSPVDSNTLYFSRDDNTLFMTSNLNATTPTWTDLTAKLPVSGALVNAIRTDPKYNNVVYIIQNEDVYVSVNRGSSWTKITGSLPSVPKSVIAIDKNSYSGLYIGTDAGVYYRDSTMSDWTTFYSGLPVEPRVMDLAIYYDAAKSSNNFISAATYGRGLWQSGLYSPVAPKAGFGINTAGQCLTGNSFVFTDSTTISAGKLATWSWDFGDSKTSTAESPTHKYTSAGTYTVKLVVTSSLGTTDNLSKTVTVYPQAAPAFTVNTANQCLSGNSYVFTDKSTVSSGKIAGWSWNFGDASSPSTTQSPKYSYAAAGTYKVILTTTTDNGCTDTVSAKVTIYPQPTASFGINTKAQCQSGNSFAFTDKSSISSGSISGWSWDFGDASTPATSQNSTHSYTSAGTYTIKLTVTSNNGCQGNTSQSVTVYPQPVALIGVNTANQCFTGNSFVFTDKSTISSGTTSTVSWDLGDLSTSTSSSVTHSYAGAGGYTIQLSEISNNGCTATATSLDTIYPQAKPAFTINTASQCLGGNSFVVTDKTTIGTGSIASWVWDFGDTTNSTIESPTHSYANSGSYRIKVFLTSDKGCHDTLSKPVTVYQQPRASFIVNNSAECLKYNSFQFTDKSSAVAGFLSSWSWNFGDGSVSSSQSPSHSYKKSGTYRVSLKVKNNHGCVDSFAQNMTVYPQITASFTVNDTAQCFEANNFVTTNSSVLPGSGTNSFAWSFGDNAKSAIQSPSHVYTSPGSYQTMLIVANTDGCKDTATKNLTVRPKITPVLSIDDSVQCLAGNLFNFLDSSSVSLGSIAGQTWDFGNGQNSASAVPSMSYAQAGKYIVTMVVQSDQGCYDSLSRTVIVNPMPSPKVIGDSTLCAKTSAVFHTASDSASDYAWTISGGNALSAKNIDSIAVRWPSFTSGIAKVVETNMYGCADSDQEFVLVKPLPSAKFGAQNHNAVCDGATLNFVDSSSSAISYYWSFGNGDTSTAFSPSYTYPNAGNYTASLAVASKLGCYDTASRQVTINPIPIAHWSVDSLQRANIVFSAKDTILPSSAYSWDFGDGSKTTGRKVRHIFPTNKTYTVKLTVTTSAGCTAMFDSALSVAVSSIPVGKTISDKTQLNVYPNPFHNSTNIGYSLDKNADVQIGLYDINGKQIGIIVQEHQAPGNYQYELDANKYQLVPGTYLLKFYVDGDFVSKSIVKM